MKDKFGMVRKKARVSSNSQTVTGTRANGVMTSKMVMDSTSTLRIRPLPNRSGKMERRRTMLGQ
tara:strand:+ start:990 stop:1181 length:192 start_codon:yes stop_codon:yes gene_type:complete